MLSKLDESVGIVVNALYERNMLNDSIIIFTTDNGGPAEGFNDNAASNYPLRGVSLVFYGFCVGVSTRHFRAIYITSFRYKNRYMQTKTNKVLHLQLK